MTKVENKGLKQQVIMDAREYRINAVLFRHVVGELLGVNVTDMECLSLIFFNGLATPSELARYTGLSSGSTTAMLDRLERSGLIERRSNPHDRRSTHVLITKDAAEKIEQLFSSVRAAQHKIVANYSEIELELLSDFFQRSATMWDEERAELVKTKVNDGVARAGAGHHPTS